MRYVTLIIIFLFWALWASFSTGGLYELKQINPEYAHPNKSVPYLLSKLSYSKSNGFWDSYHVEGCSWYMPNWAKAEQCVRVRISCESKSPKKKDSFGEHADIFSKEFRSCWTDNRPFMGPVEWMRTSRTFLRIGVISGSLWLTGGWDKKGEEASKWEAKNIFWAKPLMAWAEKGE
jgi:hypothetical protein